VRKALPWLLFAVILALVGFKLRSSHFDWSGFAHICRTANLGYLALAALVINSNNILRALRWSIFLRPAYRVTAVPHTPWQRLIGSQFIGFTGLAIFGRVGELIRPLLVARRTQLSFPSQVAVVAVERLFDLVAFALLFSCNLLISPQLQALPYLHRAGYSIAALTAAIAIFVLGVRLAGATLARIASRLLQPFSPTLATAAHSKILAFRHGLNVIDTFADFALTALLSLTLWITIAFAYLLVLKAFPVPVHALNLSHVLVLMGFSIAGSALPIPGGSGAWAGNVFALTTLLGIPSELAVGAGLMVWLITTLSVVPAGLVCARLEGVSLTQLTGSGKAQENSATTA